MHLVTKVDKSKWSVVEWSNINTQRLNVKYVTQYNMLCNMRSIVHAPKIYTPKISRNLHYGALDNYLNQCFIPMRGIIFIFIFL